MHVSLYSSIFFVGVKTCGLWMFCSTGLPGEEERVAFSHFQPKKMENWDEHIINTSSMVPLVDVIKHEVSRSGNNIYHPGHGEFQVPGASWSNMVTVSSPRSSSVTSLSSNNLLDFTYNNKVDHRKINQLPDHTSEVINNLMRGSCCSFLFSSLI